MNSAQLIRGVVNLPFATSLRPMEILILTKSKQEARRPEDHFFLLVRTMIFLEVPSVLFLPVLETIQS